MDAVPYIDDLVKEYLLFRGYTDAYQAFCVQSTAELPLIDAGPVADTLRTLCKNGDINTLMDIWSIISTRFTSKMTQREFFHQSSSGLLRSLQRCLIVETVQSKKRSLLSSIFERIFRDSPSELTDSSLEWADWLMLPYIPQPNNHSRLSPFFSRAWRSSVFTALHNFLSTVFSGVPLPSLLQLRTKKMQLEAQEQEILKLRREILELKQSFSDSASSIRRSAPFCSMNGQNCDLSEPVIDSSQVERAMSLPLLSNEIASSFHQRLLGHSSAITSCRFSSSGDMLASSSLDGTIRVWAHDGTCTPVFDMSPCNCVEWDARSHNILYYGNSNGKIKLWNSENKRMIREINTGVESCPNIISVCSSPSDSLFVASCASESLISGFLGVWSSKTSQMAQSFTAEPVGELVLCTAFNHNGTLCAMGSTDGFIRLLDLASNTAVMSWQAHSRDVHRIAFGADETTIISCGCDDRVIEWNLHRLGHLIREIVVLPGAERSSSKTRLDFACDEANAKLCIANGMSNAAVYDWETGTSSYVVPTAGKGIPVLVDWSAARRLSCIVMNDHTIELHALPMS